MTPSGDAAPTAAPEPGAPIESASPLREILVAAAVLIGFALLGEVTGWRGPRKTAISTYVWPFYIDTWFEDPVFTLRAIWPLVGLALVQRPLRRWLAPAFAPATARRSDPLALAGLLAAAYVVHLGCGAERGGLEWGLTRVFRRSAQEYWGDLHFVHAGFLARFPEVGRLSQHGATHPPGLTLLLAALVAIGLTQPMQAALVCSLAPVLTALSLYGAARRLAGEASARLATVLFLFASSVVAFAVLAMDACTMLFATTALYCLTVAMGPSGGAPSSGMIDRGATDDNTSSADAIDDGTIHGGATDEPSRITGWEIAASILWGLWFAVASFCTFTSLTLGLGWAVLLGARWRRLTRDGWRRLAVLALGPLAFVGFYAALTLFAGYRPFHVLVHCLDQFARSDDAMRPYARALLGNPVAFLGALGLPLMGLAGRAARDTVRWWRLPDRRAVALLIVAALVPVVACILLGKPRAEVERIYLLFVPPLMIALAAAAIGWYRRGLGWARVVVALLVVQSTLIEIFFDTLW